MTKVHVKRGQEGPKFDPYGFEEYYIERPDKVPVKVHIGLAVWIQVEYAGGPQRLDFSEADDYFCGCFHAIVGVSMKAFQRAVVRMEGPPKNCPDCGRTSWKGEYHSGFPGETFLVCKCGCPLFSWFNESAVI